MACEEELFVEICMELDYWILTVPTEEPFFFFTEGMSFFSNTIKCTVCSFCNWGSSSQNKN